jgi:hypothetical protein
MHWPNPVLVLGQRYKSTAMPSPNYSTDLISFVESQEADDPDFYLPSLDDHHLERGFQLPRLRTPKLVFIKETVSGA